MRERARDCLRVAGRSSWFALAAIVVVLVGSVTAAADIVDVIRVDEALVRTSAGPDGFEQVALEGFSSRVRQGEPMVPVTGRTYLLPEGMRVARVEVVSSTRRELDGEHRVLPGGHFEASMNGGVQPLRADIANSPREYPGPLVELATEGWMRGHRVASVSVAPLQYRPSDHRLVLYPEISFRLVLEPDETPDVVRRSRVSQKGWEQDRRFVANVVENWSEGKSGVPVVSSDGMSRAYSPTDIPSLDGSLVEYLIITGDDLVLSFEPLAEWKTRCGVPAEIRTVSWIQDHYPGGADLQEQIRNFIRDAYTKWGTLWVVLGGDEEIIPARVAHCNYYGSGDWMIPSDLYYECLEGNWNADGDNLFGEGYVNIMDPGDDADLYPEVAVGRVPAQTTEEVEMFIDHLMEYQFPDSVGYQTRALFIGEVVFPTFWSPGEDIYLNGKDCCQYGMNYLPSHWDTTTLFEYPDDTETRESVIAAFDEGYAFTAYVSHGDAFKMSTADDKFVYVGDVNAFTNGGNRGIMFDLNCHLSQFDLECMNERFLFNPNGGLIAPLGCTHFDFPHVGQFYLGEFCRLMWQTDMTSVGEINGAHKLPYMSQCTADLSAFRWTALTYMLMGDPEMTVWTDLPESLVIAHPGTIGLSGGGYLVEVSDGTDPVEGATVCFWKEEGSDYARGVTDALGQATLELHPSSLGGATLVVTRQNFYPAMDSVIVSGGAARVFVESVEIDDDDVGLSSGNGDGFWDAGETVEISVTLKNGGDTAADNVTAELGLPSGSVLTGDVSVDGVPDPSRVHIGRDGVNPAAIPFAVNLSGDSLWGKPYFAACSDTAMYLWEDASGWHVRCDGGLGAHTFAGTLSTDGEIQAASAFGLEDDVFSLTDVLTFGFSVDTTECEDGLDFRLADSFFVDIVDTTEDFGWMDAGATVTRSFAARAEVNTMDQHQARFLLDIAEGTKAGQWVDGFRLEIGAPILSDHFHILDDTTYGNANWIPETGDTLIVTCYIANDGAAEAVGVEGTLTALANAVILDGDETLGDIAAGDMLEAFQAFTVECTGDTPSVRLELTDAYGAVWREDWELAPPAVPTGLVSQTAGPAQALITWDPMDEDDVVGFNVYRAMDGEYIYYRITDRVLGKMAYFEDYDLLPVKRYWYRIASVDTSGNLSPVSGMSTRWTNPYELSGWPQRTLNHVYASPAVVDIDGNGVLDVVVASMDWRVWVWDAFGNLRSGFPVSTEDEIWSSPTVANLDEDNELEIFTGSNDGDKYAWNHDGTGLLRTSGIFAYDWAATRSTAAIADVDNDWENEVFLVAYSRLMAWNRDGTGYLNPDGVFKTLGPGESGGSPALADVDNDECMEIFIGRVTGDLYAWNHDGTGLVDSTGLFGDCGGIWTSPAIGDVDNDGGLEIVISDMSGYVYVWDDTGAVLPGWPKQTWSGCYSSPALGDIDGDNDLEIVVGSNDFYLWAWHHDGTSVNPTYADGRLGYCGDDVWSSPVMGDLDEDGDLEMLVGSTDGWLYAYHGDGGAVYGFPIDTGEPIYSTPVITDLDEDGDIEVIVASYDAAVHVYDLSSSWNQENVPWPMFRHDVNRTGLFGYIDITPVAGEEIFPREPIRTALDQNYPNPCNPRTTVSYSVANPCHVEITLYNVQGQRVTTLVNAPRETGRYTVEWEGTDSKGVAVSSGVYFCRMTAGAEKFSRKVIMLK